MSGREKETAMLLLALLLTQLLLLLLLLMTTTTTTTMTRMSDGVASRLCLPKETRLIPHAQLAGSSCDSSLAKRLPAFQL
jgi:energy-coupling factor transporter transmembrane protein EcfT